MSNYYFIYLLNQNERTKRTKVKLMCKIVHVAVHIINQCIEKDIPIDYYKTQKLAYLCQIEHLKKHDVPLAPESVWNWSCGAGFKEIYAFFKTNGIKENDNINASINKVLDLLLFEKETINFVIDTYAHLPFEEIKSMYKYDGVPIGEIVTIDLVRKLILENNSYSNKEDNT